jgi:hypothetical protein
MAPGDLGDRRAGALAAGQRHAVHQRALDHALDVGGLDEHVGVDARRRAGVAEQLLQRQRALRAVAGVLEQDRVAEQQVGPGEPDHLVERVVPRLDAEQRSQRLAQDHRVAGVGRDRPWRREGRPRVAVVQEDPRREVRLRAGVADELAHLQRHDLREAVAALGEQLAGTTDDPGALADGAAPPATERLVGGLDRPVDLLAVERVELHHALAGVGVGGRVVLRVSCGSHARSGRPRRRRVEPCARVVRPICRRGPSLTAARCWLWSAAWSSRSARSRSSSAPVGRARARPVTGPPPRAPRRRDPRRRLTRRLIRAGLLLKGLLNVGLFSCKL